MFHPNNSQVRNDMEMGAIQASILAEGFTAENIIVNPWNNKIVSGHGRVQACWNLGHRGDLPVVFQECPSEEAHRLAMLRWNRARGHQDAAKEMAEVTAMVAAYERETVATALAYSDDRLAAMMGEYPTIEGKEAERTYVDEAPEGWPVIKVQISPETMLRYKSLLELAKGDSEGAQMARILQCVNPARFPYKSSEDSQEYDDTLGDDLWDGELDDDE